MRKLLLASLLSLTAIGFSGCVLVGPGNTQLKLGNSVVGEFHAQSGGLHGYLVTLYAPITTVIKAFHDVNCVGRPEGRDRCTLRWLKTFDGSAQWHQATADDEAGDFHDAMTGMPHPGYDCVAVQITPGGENWTYRHASDSSCTP